MKSLASAKSRLAPVLSAAERRVLATLMLQDVLDHAMRCAQLERVAVVTADVAVRQMLKTWSVELIDEPHPFGHSQAVKHACGQLASLRVKKVLVLSSDVPTTHAAEMTLLTQIGGCSPSVIVATDRHGLGSNALSLSPPDVINPRFGADSLRQHCKAASQRGVAVATLRLEGMGLDIDEPRDLALLCDRGAACRSSEFLNSSDIARRVRRYVADLARATVED